MGYKLFFILLLLKSSEADVYNIKDIADESLFALLPPECNEYLELNDTSRNTEQPSFLNCDDIDDIFHSPDWAGTNWYRMTEPAGTQMPESSPGYQSCGTYYPGWVQDTHPEVAEQSKEVKIC